MAKWCTVLPILSATVIAVVLCPGTAIVDSRLQLAKSWVDTQWSRLQPLEPASHVLNISEVRNMLVLYAVVVCPCKQHEVT